MTDRDIPRGSVDLRLGWKALRNSQMAGLNVEIVVDKDELEHRVVLQRLGLQAVVPHCRGERLLGSNLCVLERAL